MFTFRKAIRENVSLLIGLAGGTGSGKSWTAMRLATGMSGGKSFVVLDTEARRALHYGDAFNFDHAEINPPFRPAAYEEAILAADAAGYPVIVVDTMSHEHISEGGLLEWHDEELDRMAGQDYKKREACNMAAWVKPKGAHRHMIQRLLQVKAHLILTFRAEEKIEMEKQPDGKMKIVPKKSRTGLDGWIPVSEKNLPYELTCSFLLTSDAPGVPKPIKLQDQHRALFPLDKPITEDSGKLIAAWAAGGSTPKPNVKAPPEQIDDRLKVSPEQIEAIHTALSESGVELTALLAKAEIGTLEELASEDAMPSVKWIRKQKKAAAAPQI